MKHQTLFAVALAVSSLTGALPRAARADGPSDLAYYQEFQYTETEDADGNVSTRFLMGDHIDVGTASQGHVQGNIELYLMKDGTYVIKWMETTDQGFPVAFRIPFTGNWSVPSDQLLVGDIAVGTRGVFDGRNAVELTFIRDLYTPGLKGKTAILDYGFSNEKPTDP